MMFCNHLSTRNKARNPLFRLTNRFVLTILGLSLSIASLADLGGQAQKRKLAAARNPIVQITLHTDLKEPFTITRETNTEHYQGKAELTELQDFTVKRQLYSDSGTIEFRELPNDPGATSGSFHYQGEEESSSKGRGPRVWYQHKMDVAGSFDPISEVEPRFTSIAKGLMVHSRAHADGIQASCSSEGNVTSGRHECYIVGQPEMTFTQVCGGVTKPKDQGTCVDFSLAYEVFPDVDPQMLAQNSDSPDARRRKMWEEDAADPYDAFSLKEWYGAVSSRDNKSGYGLDFDGFRKYDDPGRNGDQTHEVGSKHLHVTLKITAPGAISTLLVPTPFGLARPVRQEDFSADLIRR